MLRKLSEWMYRISTGWVALVALGVFLLFTALVLPGQASEAESFAEDVGSPDMSFYYTPAELYHMAEKYGAEGRRTYVRARFTFDLLWPLIYTVFLSTGISWVYRRAFAADSLWRWANLAPVAGALFDYLENSATSLVMIRYPEPTVIVAGLATVFTMVKWILVNGSFVMLFAGVVVGVIRWMRPGSGM
jgi:uncharacterized Fe-S cluster-containing radical SAM superfamily protein